MTIKRWSLVAVVFAGCAGADQDPQVRVTLTGITVTSVDSGAPAMEVFGTLSAATAYDTAILFDHDVDHPVPLDTGVVWPTQGIVGQGIVTIPTHDLDPPYEIEVQYSASYDRYNFVREDLTVLYEDGMSESIGFNVHNRGGILLQLTFEEM